MEEDKPTEQMNIRMPFGLLQEVDDLVKTGRYRSRGDVILAAVRHYMDHVAVDKKYLKLEPVGQPSFEEFAKSAREKP